MKLERVDADLELEFWREFAIGNDDNLMCKLSADDRRERIRVAIFKHKLERQPFRDGPESYGQVYARCYGRPIELRRKPRDAVPAE